MSGGALSGPHTPYPVPHTPGSLFPPGFFRLHLQGPVFSRPLWILEFSFQRSPVLRFKHGIFSLNPSCDSFNSSNHSLHIFSQQTEEQMEQWNPIDNYYIAVRLVLLKCLSFIKMGFKCLCSCRSSCSMTAILKLVL